MGFNGSSPTKPVQTQITLRLGGSRAARGVSLLASRASSTSFIGALRDFYRDRREAPTRKSGRPKRRAEAVTAFRLVRFESGSGIATIEPEAVSLDEQEQLPLDEIPLPLENLLALTDDLDAGVVLPEPVTDALAKASELGGPTDRLRLTCPRATAPDKYNALPLARLLSDAHVGARRRALRDTWPPPGAQELKARIQLDRFAVVVRDDLW
jgi:hypothetical protein